MTNLRSIKLSFKPTAKIMEAVDHLTEKLRSTETYTGKWLTADTIRYLLHKPYVEHSYPKNIRRATVRSVNMSDEDISKMSPMLDEDYNSKCAWVFRLICSGLIQEGYLSSDVQETEESKPKLERTKIRSPRRCETQDISA